MLRNLKVGTKLFVILLAPVVVIVALVGVGVRDRRSDAHDAAKVEELSSFALVGTDLVSQLQVEELYSAVYTASRGQMDRTELDQQRTRTDAALARYQAALVDLTPPSEDSSLGPNLKLAQNRLGNIKGIRGAVDSSLTQPYAVEELFGDVISSFVGVNAALAGEADASQLLRGLDARSRIEQVREAQNAQATLLVGAAQSGGFTDRSGALCPDVQVDCETYLRLEAATSTVDRANENLSRSGATPEQKQAVTNASGESTYRDMATELAREGEDGNRITTTGTDALATALTGLEGLTQVDTSLTQQVVDQARDVEAQANRSVVLYLLAGAIGLAVAFAIAVVVARSITRPLHRLTRAAGRLSNEQLPALVEQLRNPDDDQAESAAESLTAIEVDSRDELGELAAAFNSIQAVTVDVAEEQGRLLRKGIGDIFVNLARRNQSLLDRQIEFIDQLESSERDPDQLENLFRLDHLATRMRRNAESLLVMAGADPPRRRGAPVPVADVVRVAIGEVEDYQRVHLIALDDATVAANVASDLAHLLSELMENATNASPPHTSVEVLGAYDARNGYVLTVADRGIGMSEQQLADANEHLASPPVVGLAITRSLGLTVVGRLAARYGLSVQLAARDEGGIVASVHLPYSLVEYAGEDREDVPSPLDVMGSLEGRPARARRTARPVPVHAGAPSPNGTADDAARVAPAPPVAPVEPAVPAEPATTPEGLPRRRSEPARSAPAPEAVPAPVAPAAVPTTPAAAPAPPAPAAAPAPAPPAPAAAPVTAAGLVRRTPTRRDAGPAAAPSGSGPSVTRTSRSPEEVRRMLSRYRSGLDRGRGTDGAGPPGAVAPTDPTTPGPEEPA
jgi:signal transduction histidine kinase